MSNIFKAHKMAKQFVLQSVTENTVQTTGVLLVSPDSLEVLKMISVTQALQYSEGYVFTYIYRNGHVELHPMN